MPSLKAIRTRIASVKNTQKVTKAMKLVAATRLRRAQDNMTAARPYAKRVAELIADASTGDVPVPSSSSRARRIHPTARSSRELRLPVSSCRL